MKKTFFFFYILMMIPFISTQAKAQTQSADSILHTEEISYSGNGVNMKGYIAYDKSKRGVRPAILVVHEWWGSNDYVRSRARMLAHLGYVAMAVDLYGDGKLAPDPKAAGEFATPFYEHPEMAKLRLEAALQTLKGYAMVDQKNIAAIGYCFGGSMLLNAAKMGIDLKGVVSFHGGLDGVPATKGTSKAKILVCHGAADKFVSDESVEKFKTNMNDAKVDYTFISYPNATHAFTNPSSTATGKKFNLPIEYNEDADKKSWADMKRFLETIFK